MHHVSDYARAEGKLERIKQESKETGHRALFLASAAGTGALYGIVNARKGGTALNPYSVAGKAPLDSVLAAAGLVSALMVRKTKLIYPVLGAAASAVGLCASRYASNWEANRMQAGSAASTTTAAGLVGHGMRSRQFGPGVAQRRHAAHSYVNQYAR